MTLAWKLFVIIRDIGKLKRSLCRRPFSIIKIV